MRRLLTYPASAITALTICLSTPAVADTTRDPGKVGDQSSSNNHSTSAASQDADADGGEQTTSEAPDDSTAQSEPSTDESESAFVSGPGAYQWSIEAGYASNQWRTAASSFEPQANLQLGAHYRLTPLWSSSLRLDWSRQAVDSGPVSFATQHWRLLGGLGVTHWIDSIRLELQAQGGALLKRTRHDSDSSSPTAATAIRPTFGTTAALGVGFLGRVAVSMTGGLHWSAPARLNPVYGVRINTIL